MCARSKQTESGDVSFYSQSTSKVDQRALRESSEDSNGEVENKALTKALQTKEQRSRACGVSSKLTWKEGFWNTNLCTRSGKRPQHHMLMWRS
jgi:hypothetical protein